MLWKLFGSEQRVQQALEQSTGYDISPNILTDEPAAKDATPTEPLRLWHDFYANIGPANTDNDIPDAARPRSDRKKA
jgi:hypothetical protein